MPPLRLSRALADLCTGPSQTSAGFPETLPFLRLFGAGKTAHLNCAVRWQENDPSRSLAAAVGTDRTGQPVCLDLHERFHGPHALVAGMTGSGKSEWLITYVLSLAVSFSPQEVAFVLIAERLSAGEAERQRWPCYVCFFPDPALAAQTELYRRLLALQKNIRMSVFAFADTLPELPRETAVAVYGSDSRTRSSNVLD